MMLPLLFNVPNPLKKKTEVKNDGKDKKDEKKEDKDKKIPQKDERKPVPPSGGKSFSRTPVSISVAEDEPEILLGLSRIISNPKSLKILQILKRESLTFTDILTRFGIETEEDRESNKKEVKKFENMLRQLEALGVVKSEWFSTGGKNVKKYSVRTIRGDIKFDFDNLARALPIEVLEDYSRQLVQIITEKGTVPKELAMKELDITDNIEFEQVIHYTEKFWSPKVRDFLTAKVVKGPEESLKEKRKLLEELREVDLKILETDIDRLMRMIRESKSSSLPVNVIAEALSVSEEQVEAWGKILEKHGLVNVQFPTTPVGKIKIELKK